MKRSIVSIILLISMILCMSTFSACGKRETISPQEKAPNETILAEETQNEIPDQEELISITYPIDPSNNKTLKYGSIVLDTTASEFMENFELGDIVAVSFEGTDILRMPVCGEYNDVPAGEALIRANLSSDNVLIAINCGQIGVELGFVEEAPENSDYKFQIIENAFPKEVTISLMEKEGYADNLIIGKLRMSKDRSSYPNLTDEEFCNFREICCGSIGSGKLYRSSSPIDSKIERNEYADKMVEKYGVKTIINMSDTENAAKAFDNFENTVYSKQNVAFICSSATYRTTSFNNNIAECLRFIAENEGPYLIHCVYGKDRTGFLCFIVEGLCGASYDEIMADYVKTYQNLYDVVDETQTELSEDIIKTIEDSMLKTMNYALEAEINASNCNEVIENFVRSIGISEEEIAVIREHLQ